MLSKSHDCVQTLYWKSSIQGLIEVLLLIIHELGCSDYIFLDPGNKTAISVLLWLSVRNGNNYFLASDPVPQYV